MACQWGGWSDDPSFLHNREGKTLFGSVRLPLDFSLDGALRKTAWLADRAYRVVSIRMGLAVRVLAADFEEIIKQMRPDNYCKFLVDLWDVSGLPALPGPDAVTYFFAGWKVTPLKTFRQGYRRTWVVRAAEQPLSTKLQHDFGLAVIKRATIKKHNKWRYKTGRSNRAEESGKSSNFPTGLGSSGCRTKTTKSTAGKRPSALTRESGTVCLVDHRNRDVCLGSETRWCRNCFWTRCRSAESAFDISTRESVARDRTLRQSSRCRLKW